MKSIANHPLQIALRMRLFCGRPLLACLFLLAPLAEAASASWAYVPQEIRFLQSDLVVVGEIEKEAKSIEMNGREYSVGLIRPTMILKGKAMMKEDIKVAWPAERGGGLRLSTDISFAVGQKGIWVLTADKAHPVYWANYPTDYQPLEKLDEVKRKLANLDNVKWSEAKDGMQIGLIVEQTDMRNAAVKVDGKDVKAIAQLSVYPLLKNSSKKIMHVVNSHTDRQVAIEFLGADGKAIAVDLYGNAPVQKQELQAHNFLKIEPGRVGTIGYGFGLPVIVQNGEYSIKLTYRNNRDGDALKIAGVWKGETSSQTVKIAVPAKQ